MAHHITQTDRMITVGKQAWHGLGKVIPKHVTPREALKLAEMDWTVEEATLSAITETGTAEEQTLVREHHEVPSHKALIRSDTKEVLGVVGSKYHVFQNSDLAGLVEDVTAGEIEAVETGGTLKGGKKVWFLVGGDNYDVAGVDPVSQYGLFANSHDGLGAIRVLPTTIRVVCHNTYTQAGADDLMKGLTIRHTSGAQMRIDEARAALTKNKEELSKFNEAADYLASREVDQKWLQEFFMRAYIDGGGTPPTPITPQLDPKELRKAERSNKKAAETIQAWFANFEDADGGEAHKKVRTTAWAAFNSVTRWADHGRKVRGEQGDPTARTFSNLLGSTAQFKSSALNTTLALMEN